MEVRLQGYTILIRALMRRQCGYGATYHKEFYFKEHTWRMFRLLPNAEASLIKINEHVYDTLETLSLSMEAKVKNRHRETNNVLVLFRRVSLDNEPFWAFGIIRKHS